MPDDRASSPILRRVAVALVLLAFTAGPAPASAQDQDEDEDLRISPAQPDYTLVAMPSAMRVPLHQSAFRVTHRFARPFSRGSFGDLLRDAFGLDGGAFIGLEYRFGVLRGLQAGVRRTSLNKTIEFFGQYGLLRQRETMPVDVSVWVSVDGTNNFRDDYSPGVGAIISRLVGQHAAFYVEPIWIGNTNPGADNSVEHSDTLMVVVGGRLRIRPTIYVVGEWAPRPAGYAPGTPHGSFAIEKRAGGHVFQLNFSNAVGTTMTQVARGGLTTGDWYLGFNISRRFN